MTVSLNYPRYNPRDRVIIEAPGLDARGWVVRWSAITQMFDVCITECADDKLQAGAVFAFTHDELLPA